MGKDLTKKYSEAAQIIATSEVLLIGAGAGMGVDSGLPDFRGNQGFWKAYPPFQGKSFSEMANPQWFSRNPAIAWGFYGHRLHLYRSTTPHQGFEILKKWTDSRSYFIFTSNVDGQFQKAGFSEHRILECHGSIHHLQCSEPCRNKIWSARDTEVEIDRETMEATSDLPRCPWCAEVARPNVLMFGDFRWIGDRTRRQRRNYRRWLNNTSSQKLAVLEFGAGTAIPTVRWACESTEGSLIRVNPRHNSVPAGGMALATGALEALTKIDEILEEKIF